MLSQSSSPLGRLLVLSALFTAAALGQGERATVTGIVTDPTGSTVVGAEVSIRNVGTNIVTRTKTNSAGIYYLPALPPGQYELRVEQAGFRAAVVADIPLGAALTATLNVSLELGTVTEAVQVQATAVQLEAQTTALGKVLQTRSIAELPLLGRNPLQLSSLLPGVQPGGGGTVAQGGKMSGGLQTQNGVLTDGAESRQMLNTRESLTVPLESVAEFRVDTATYAAEYGRAGGGVVNVVTKSGTNEFHGVLYEFLRNDHLNANSWQNNRNNVPKGGFQRNEFGGAMGGPIVRNRTFFFANYERMSQGSPSQFLATVPTPAQKQGDFTQTFDASGRQDIVYDPLTTRSDPAQPGKYIRDAFPGNRIPGVRLHPISQNVAKYWPAGNRPGEGPALFNNYFKSWKNVTTNDTWVARVDHIISDRHRLFGRFVGRQSKSFSSGLTDENLAFPAQSVSNSPIRSAVISLTSTFSPTLLGELRLSYIRLQSNNYPVNQGFDISSLGFPASLAAAVQYKAFPQIFVQQYAAGTALAIQGGSASEVDALTGSEIGYSPQDTGQVQYHLTVLRNRHKIKLGTDLQLLRLATYSTNAPDGRYYFDRAYTQGPDPLQVSSASGNGFATFLLGVPIAGSLGFGPALKIHGRYYGLYFQDDIQLTNKLTANLGLRYEYTTPWTEKFGQIGNFVFDAIEPVTGAKGDFRFLQPGQYQNDPSKKRLGPRVGLAYRLTSKTVIRAAGGIFFAANDTLNPGTSDWGNGLFVLNESALGPPNPFPNTPPVGGSWSNPFAAGLVQPTRSTTFEGQNIRAYTRRHLIPYVSNWTFNIQQMVAPTLLVEVGYVGNKVTRLSENRNYNQNNPLLLSLGPQLLERVPNPYLGKITSGPLSFPTVERRQLLRPYPQFLQVLIPRDGYGDAHYHSFQLRIDKQYSHGLTFSVGYTVSKTITNNHESATGERLTQNAQYDPNYSRSPDSNDIPQRLVLGYMWELPLGRHRPYLSTGVLSQIIGNWQISGITVLQSGIPLRIVAPDNTGLLNFVYNVGRGNRLCDPVLPAGQRTPDKYFNTSCFVAAPPFTMPNDSLNQPRLRNPGRRNFDMSLMRNQPFKERYNVQFRAEFFNFFNTPALSLGEGSSVTVNTPQFGKILSGTSPREVQLGLRIVF